MGELGQQALATLAQHNVVPAAYIAHWGIEGKWYGDTCGCVDDRCIGHHHDGADGCGCLEGWIDEYLKTVTPMAVSFNTEYEQWYVERDLYDVDRPETHLINPPKELAARYHEAAATEAEALRQLTALAGVNSETGLSLTPCPRWSGFELSSSEWWTAQVPPSGSDDQWPAGSRGVDIGPHHDTAGETVAWIRSLPASFHLLTAYSAAVVEIDRSTLVVEAHLIRGGPTECEHCGHSRDAHPDKGEPMEVSRYA